MMDRHHDRIRPLNRPAPRWTRRSLLAGLTGAALATTGRATALPVLPPPRGVRLEVTPNPVAVAAPFAVRVTGLTPGATVTVRAVTPAARGIPWQADGTFVADPNGFVDLGAQAPDAGTWATIDPTALIWSATPDNGLGALNTFPFAPSLQPDPTVITAEVGGREAARVELARTFLTPAVVASDLAEGGLVGRFFRPADGGPHPGALVLGGSEGGLRPFTAALLATHGIAALALAYFSEAGLPPTLAEIPLEYFGDALAWLRAQPAVGPNPLAVVGQSRGGELALLLGATYPEIGAVVSYVGSGIVFSSPDDFTVPAWTHRGEAAPHFFDPDSANAAQIPVERIGGPVLLISGDDDRLWPSALLSDIAMDRLQARGHPYPDAHLRYPDAGHLIQPPFVPTMHGLDAFGGTPAATAAANADAWPRVLALLTDGHAG